MRDIPSFDSPDVQIEKLTDEIEKLSKARDLASAMRRIRLQKELAAVEEEW